MLSGAAQYKPLTTCNFPRSKNHLKKCQRQQFAFCPFRLQLYGAKAGWSLHCISCFQGLNKHFLKVKICAWLIFTGRIVLLPDVASVVSRTKKKILTIDSYNLFINPISFCHVDELVGLVSYKFCSWLVEKIVGRETDRLGFIFSPPSTTFNQGHEEHVSLWPSLRYI